MILDWKYNSQKVFNNQRYFTTKLLCTEMASYIKFLFDLGYDYQEVFIKWKQIPNNLLDEPDDSNEVDWDNLFDKLLKRAAKIKFPNTCGVTQQEIDFVNKLEAPLWYRKFVIIRLAYTRGFGSDRYFYWKNSTRERLLQLIGFAHSFEDLDKKISQLDQLYKICEVYHCQGMYGARLYNSYTCVKMTCMDTDHEYVAVCDTIEEPKALFINIQPYVKKCITCGAEFEINSYTQRTECPVCYKKRRNNR